MLAIEAYQAVMVNMNPPSGRVEPGSVTYYSFAAHPLVDDTPKTVESGITAKSRPT